MITIILNFVEQFQTVLFAIVGLLIGISVIQTWARTRSLAPTLGVVILGAVVLWSLASVPFIREEVTEDIDANNPTGTGGNDDEPCAGRPTNCRIVVVELGR